MDGEYEMKMIFKITALQTPTKITARCSISDFMGHYSASWSTHIRKCLPSNGFYYFFSIWIESVASDYKMTI